MQKLKITPSNTTPWQLCPLEPEFFQVVVSLANKVHGEGYLTLNSLASMVARGCLAGKNASYVAVLEDKVVAYRLSFAAGQWQPDQWCSVADWPVNTTTMAYFKSVAVSQQFQGYGIGQALLQQSIRVLKQQGAEGGLAHLWRESPNNSAVRYFSKAGATLVAIHENRWQHLSAQGYICPRCDALCSCSAAEMVLMF
ncbi:hypothetical protein GCM10010919_28590 [Alishewanella longhuensis]|uniref:N-acetyltransferase domain-containing protein n=1 Tax=Alishewanella longhuensis TaxID=1091037 RepID=A0ABQ3L130_9ALTE|nr:GNAT family N-acetyltransferase [Alishewanella longhuensis]GHG74818.1 hypothetical protein GCM10010919_28590 [Alishewanella longhuensis]